jgi:hypothetical protein
MSLRLFRDYYNASTILKMVSTNQFSCSASSNLVPWSAQKQPTVSRSSMKQSIRLLQMLQLRSCGYKHY